MAKRQFQLDETGSRQWRGREQQTGSIAELKRLQAVRRYGRGTGMAQIVDIPGCAESSVREWVQDYKHEGLVGLRPHWARSAQNASKLSAAQRTDRGDRLHPYRPDQV